MIKAIVFDFDGTIVDTETAWYYAFQQAYESCGAELTLETFAQCIGTSHDHFNPYEYINTLLEKPVDADIFRKQVHDRHSVLMENEALRPGIIEILQAARAAGLKIGLATSSKREWIDKYLELHNLQDYFECIHTMENVKKVKPDPELYNQVLDCLGVRGDEAIALEDSPNGAKAAVQAGMYCVVIPNSITKTLPFGEVHLRVDTLEGMDYESLFTQTFKK
ncbi:HAD family hydrolase [Paenibacillus senegalensis]|uniref:HAD family hydrolase n=1 Tax=Paenibacillus senegalensis TaxID=1465766 RepID=UPI000288DDEC|nr:HAD family hydrolase [Paenibacillus senegalensis]